MNNKLYKLDAVTQLLEQSSFVKKKLLDELLVGATDNTVFMRRFRMISQVSDFESQAIKKIYNFNSDSLTDYSAGLTHLLDELNSVALRNA